MKLLYFIAACMVFITISASTYAQEPQTNATIKVGNCEIKIIPVANGRFGYEISKNKKLLIHQTTIPAMPGNNGFTTKTDAEKIARKVAEKINNGETLPSLSAIEVTDLVPLPKIKQ